MRPSQRGFSLVEILVVLVIVGLSVSLATVTLGKDTRTYRWDRAVEQLADVLALAVEETEYAGQTWRVKVVRGDSAENWSYHWQQLVGDQWQAFEGNDWVSTLFGQTDLPEDLQLAVKLQDRYTAGALAQGIDSAGEEIYFLASGEVTPFEITITDRNGLSYQRIIAGDMAGKIMIDPVYQPDATLRPAG